MLGLRSHSLVTMTDVKLATDCRFLHIWHKESFGFHVLQPRYGKFLQHIQLTLACSFDSGQTMRQAGPYCEHLRLTCMVMSDVIICSSII